MKSKIEKLLEIIFGTKTDLVNKIGLTTLISAIVFAQFAYLAFLPHLSGV